jgi:hypothetical protein
MPPLGARFSLFAGSGDGVDSEALAVEPLRDFHVATDAAPDGAFDPPPDVMLGARGFSTTGVVAGSGGFSQAIRKSSRPAQSVRITPTPGTNEAERGNRRTAAA